MDKSLFSPQSVAGPDGLIAHALGGIEGLVYSNCREAFLASCQAGFRLLEADLALTRDGRIVCYHEPDSGPPLPRPLGELSGEEFLALRFAGKYTPLDSEGLLDLLARHENVLLLTDTKDRNRQVLPRLIAAARTRGPNVLPRIVPQTYSREDLNYVRGLGCFPTIIFICYLCAYDDDEIVSLAGGGGVSMIAMATHRYHPKLRERLHAAGCGVYVHTVNDPGQAAAFRAEGVGIYSDFCRPS